MTQTMTTTTATRNDIDVVTSHNRNTTTPSSTSTPSSSNNKRQTTHVYVKNDKFGWIPAEILSSDGDRASVLLSPPSPKKPLTDNYSLRKTNQDYEENTSLTDSTCSSTIGSGRIDMLDIDEIDDLLDESSTPKQRRYPVSIDLSDYPSHTLPLQNVDSEGRLVVHDNMSDLEFLHEPSILFNLKERYEGVDGVPYTRAGDIILSVNPYRWIKGLYSPRTRKTYAEHLVWKAGRFSQLLPPHIYEASSKAYHSLIMDGEDQSILVSGESGAGKTVSVKILMSHLATFEETKSVLVEDPEKVEDAIVTSVSRLGTFAKWFKHRLFDFVFGNPERAEVSVSMESEDEPDELHQGNDIIQRVLDSNPLLEAFGNAKTLRNDNSSRFSKFIQLQFDVRYLNRPVPSCALAGSRCKTFLLEKCRVVSHDIISDERTFHIFYQLLAAPDKYKEEIWTGLEGTNNLSFRYVGHTRTRVIEGLTDTQRWMRTLAALRVVGIQGESYFTLMRALCVVLQLGNISFDVDPANEEGSTVVTDDELDKLTDILGVHSNDITQALTMRTVRTHDEVYKVPLNVHAAKETCDALSKEIYARMFDWLVRSINDATCAEKNYGDKSIQEFGVIGLLDIFGFETFEVNHFEQMCINHANEKLQQKFTEDIFRSVQMEYKAEGIDLYEVKFEDNSNVLRLIEGRMGLIKLLNEECIRPKGSDTGFVNKLYANIGTHKSPLFKKRGFRDYQFGVNHYAGPVIYDANLFVAKNVDTLPEDVVECARKSTNDLIRKELTAWKEEKKTRKGSLVAHTVWTKFRAQLSTLMDEIGQTRTWYVRCINPNTKKEAGVMDLKYSASQLRCAGIVSAITISRESFPNRLPFQATLNRFRVLAKSDFVEAKSGLFGKIDVRKSTENLLNVLLRNLETISPDGTILKPYVCGKTRIYFRAGSLEYLEAERLRLYENCATKIQSLVRRNSAMSRYDTIRKHPNWKLRKTPSYKILLPTVIVLPFLLWKTFARMPMWVQLRQGCQSYFSYR